MNSFVKRTCFNTSRDNQRVAKQRGYKHTTLPHHQMSMQLLRIRDQRRHLPLQELPFQTAEPTGRVVSRLCAVADGEEEVPEGLVVGAAGAVEGCCLGGDRGWC